MKKILDAKESSVPEVDVTKNPDYIRFREKAKAIVTKRDADIAELKKQLAEKIGVSSTTIIRWEKNVHGVSKDNFKKLQSLSQMETT